MKEMLRRLRYLLRRDQFERELDEEMRDHLARSAADCGSLEAARRQFGNLTLLKEESRSMWMWTFAEQLAQDARQGMRAMCANPLFTAMAVLSLALGIGANTAIFSFMDAILLRSLPVVAPEQLVVLRWNAKQTPPVIRGMSGSRFSDKATGVSSPNFPFPAVESLAAERETLRELFAYAMAWRLNVSVHNQAEFLDAQLVSGGYFSGLGVTPAAGRLIAPDDDRPGAPPVVVLSHAWWQRRFAGSPEVIGQSIRINNVAFTIAGVAAPEFFGVDPARDLRIFLPLRQAPLLTWSPAQDERRRFFDRNFYWVEMMGRLRPGVTMAQAEAALAGRFRQYAESTASNAKERAMLPTLRLAEGAGGLDSLRRQYSRPLWVLMAMVGLILTIACANLASLLLARGAARSREIAVRLSLGASRGRVVRQLLTESVLLSLTGGLLGLFLALWGIRAITWLLANGSAEFTLRAALNWPVLGFTLALSTITGVLFGLAPALQATRPDIAGTLKQAGADARGYYRRFTAGRVLVAGQIALSLLIVVGAGLFVRTLSNLYAVKLGFKHENVLLFGLSGRQAGYQDAALAGLYDDVRNRLRGIPGVRSVGAAHMPLVSGYWNSWDLYVPGVTPISGVETCVLKVDPAFLRTMEIPVLLGRGIEERDMGSPRVAVVNEIFAKKYFPGQNPVGRYMGLNVKTPTADIQIVGVAKTTLYNSVKEKETPPLAYIPYTQGLAGLNTMYFHLRSAGDPLALAGEVRKAVRAASASVPIDEIRTQRVQIDRTIAQERTFASLCTGFAALALLIACVGLYGTMAYTVARRTREIGIRMALGARQRSIVGMVLREVFSVALAGVAIGTVAAWASTRLVESYLFGVKQHDPAVLAASALVLAAAALAAGCAPAWRAARIDPLAALRQE